MSLSASWSLEIDPQVYKNLKKLPRRDVERIVKTIESLPANPYLGDIQKMAGEKNVWCRRVGEYRVFFEIVTADKVINVFWVERRTSRTY